MSWLDNINTIKEIYPGQFQIILDFATSSFIKYALDLNYKYVWVSNHYLKGSLIWEEYSLPLFNNQNNIKVLARNINFDYILTTKDFIELLPKIEKDNGIHLIQMNKTPKEYLTIDRIKGKTRYQLLTKECDYLFELDIPSARDYGTIISSNRQYLQSLLDNPKLDWTNLP
ncbi:MULTISPECIES: hypothetical protein [unclassified Arcicella]|uniref:hypothetical protein n=1 Tax=unclassified Arcicella TaxID=2644986 RepID=UPI0028619ACA|nr:MULTISPECIES: hypothetical protein [unclassified Arcicella]MDR6563026.1 hypothetical protein [Arcicella sp. BE51]MDR6813110.1 hypothetical protein [Arcicella sp. BE140]MDR6824424.1 hypothetical protein [Arcicella sp. BE139]